MGAGGSRAATGLALKHCTLFKADRSPACRAVMMALDAMNLSVNEVDINMDKGEHRTPEMMVINNQQTLPVLKDRELILCDSHAINTYLASRYCKSERILPRDPGGRALVDQLLHYDSGVLYPRYKAAAYPILYENCRFVMPQHVCEIEAAYADLEGMLMGRTWFSGPWPSLGDISIAATVSTLHTIVPIDKMRYPRLSSWLYRVSEEMFYVTANKKGLTEFSRRVDCGYCDDSQFKCPRTSSRRRTVGNVIEPAGKLSNAAGRLAVASGMNEDIRCIYDCHFDQHQTGPLKSELLFQNAKLLEMANFAPANESRKPGTKLETSNPELANESEKQDTDQGTAKQESANAWKRQYTVQEMVHQALCKKQDNELESANQKTENESQKPISG